MLVLFDTPAGHALFKADLRGVASGIGGLPYSPKHSQVLEYPEGPSLRDTTPLVLAPPLPKHDQQLTTFVDFSLNQQNLRDLPTLLSEQILSEQVAPRTHE